MTLTQAKAVQVMAKAKGARSYRFREFGGSYAVVVRWDDVPPFAGWCPASPEDAAATFGLVP